MNFRPLHHSMAVPEEGSREFPDSTLGLAEIPWIRARLDSKSPCEPNLLLELPQALFPSGKSSRGLKSCRFWMLSLFFKENTNRDIAVPAGGVDCKFCIPVLFGDSGSRSME